MTLADDLKATVHRRAGILLARQSLWHYCQMMDPSFYTDDRTYLRNVCDTLQDFYQSDDRVLVMCMPPRHGKSYTAQMFTEWVFGQDLQAHIITVSYNEELSTTFAKQVRNTIMTRKAQEDLTVYSDIFPGVKVKHGSASMKLWGLEGGKGEHSYLSSSMGGSITGFGASLVVCDDTVKNAEEAYNERRLDQIWQFFTNTLLSRREPGMKIVIIMTRWAEKDLAGRALEHFEGIGIPVRKILYKAKTDDGMLCPAILSEDDYNVLLNTQDKAIVMANYQQEPIDVQGRLYTGFRTYRERPELLRVMAYCDTADEGSDYLCSIVFGQLAESPEDVAILDVIYTQEPMEKTEPMVADQLLGYYPLRVASAMIESNNGGRGFARAVADIVREHGGVTQVGWFSQTHNKRARILTAAPWLMRHAIMPEHWADLWPEFWKHIVTFTADGKADHDDAEDALSGVCELMTAPKKQRAVIRPKARNRNPFANPSF